MPSCQDLGNYVGAMPSCNTLKTVLQCVEKGLARSCEIVPKTFLGSIRHHPPTKSVNNSPKATSPTSLTQPALSLFCDPLNWPALAYKGENVAAPTSTNAKDFRWKFQRLTVDALAPVRENDEEGAADDCSPIPEISSTSIFWREGTTMTRTRERSAQHLPTVPDDVDYPSLVFMCTLAE